MVTAICVVVLQVPVPQTVPLAYSWQAALPSHNPFCMQVDAAAFWQAGRAAGAGWFAAAAVQRPSKPARLHCQQLPIHADSQQTPSTQKPDAQPAAAVQWVPTSRRHQAGGTARAATPGHAASSRQPAGAGRATVARAAAAARLTAAPAGAGPLARHRGRRRAAVREHRLLAKTAAPESCKRREPP